jgi:hypothetical protein
MARRTVRIDRVQCLASVYLETLTSAPPPFRVRYASDLSTNTPTGPMAW